MTPQVSMIIFLIVEAIFIVGMIYFWLRINKHKELTIDQLNNVVRIARRYTPPTTTVDLQPIQKQINELPNKVLTSITNSTNTYKGSLGELIGYLELRAAYDRIIPLGSIVDFVCVKLPSDTHPGCIDFIDIKTGHKARLSKEQRALQKLIEDKKINFCCLKVEASDADYSSRD